MELKVRAPRITIAFANAVNTNPLTGCEEFPVLINVGGVRFRRIALEYGHHVNVSKIEQASVATPLLPKDLIREFRANLNAEE